jgi:hypothetical protein
MRRSNGSSDGPRPRRLTKAEIDKRYPRPPVRPTKLIEIVTTPNHFEKIAEGTVLHRVRPDGKGWRIDRRFDDLKTTTWRRDVLLTEEKPS